MAIELISIYTRGEDCGKNTKQSDRLAMPQLRGTSRIEFRKNALLTTRTPRDDPGVGLDRQAAYREGAPGAEPFRRGARMMEGSFGASYLF